jgi:hypothetical protein
MRFRGTTTPTNYWGKKFQLRMILMVLALALVIGAIQKTSNPSFWAVWFPEDSDSSQPDSAASTEPIPALQESQDREQLGQDEFLNSLADHSDGARKAADGADSPDSPPAGEPSSEEKVPGALPELPSASGPREVPVDLERLHSIQDNAVEIRPQEAESLYYLLEHAAHVPLDLLRTAGDSRVARESLLHAPDFYRGKPILLEGEIRRLLPQDATPNVHAIDSYFDAWIFPTASANVPWRVLAMEADVRIPRQETIRESVSVRLSGYFFKIQGYAANSGLMVTPVLVARKIELIPPRPENPLVAESGAPWKWLFAVFCFIFVTAIWSVLRSRKGEREVREYRKSSFESQGDLSLLAGRESFRPEAHLGEIIDDSRQDE